MASYFYSHIFNEYLEMNFKLPGTRKIGKDPGFLKRISQFSGNMTAEMKDKQIYCKGYVYQCSRIAEKHAYWIVESIIGRSAMPEQLPVTQ